MTKAVGQDAAMVESLREVTKLFEDAQVSVFKLMASVSYGGSERRCWLTQNVQDSVPKFMKSAKYEQTLKNYDFDSISTRYNNTMVERSMSRSNASNRWAANQKHEWPFIPFSSKSNSEQHKKDVLVFGVWSSFDRESFYEGQ